MIKISSDFLSTTKKMLKFACFVLFIAPVLASLGVNLHGPVTVDNLKCLQQAGFNYINIPLSNLSTTDGTNPDIKNTVSNALTAGIGMIDGTIDLCPKRRPDVTTYISAIIRSSSDVLYSTVQRYLLDVENQPDPVSGEETCWSNDTAANIAYIRAARKALITYEASGVYTNEANWTAITGGGFNGVHIGVLGWAHLDNNATLADFKPFGGWTVPAEKHFKSGNLCGIRISYVWGEHYFCAIEGTVCGQNLMDCCNYGMHTNTTCVNGFCKSSE